MQHRCDVLPLRPLSLVIAVLCAASLPFYFILLLFFLNIVLIFFTRIEGEMERVPSSDSPKKRSASISGWGADGAASDKERRRSSVGRGGGAGGEEEGVVTLHSPHKKAKVHADVTAEAQAQVRRSVLAHLR
jgi:hypothetical protein